MFLMRTGPCPDPNALL
jgi:hypothetical protein